MKSYKSFKVVLYCPAQWADEVTPENLEEQYNFFKKYINPDKVYLETYRSGFLVNRGKIMAIKKYFEECGVEVSGGITTTTAHEVLSGKEYKSQRLFDTYCYTDPDMRLQLQKIVEFTAEIFDEFILDDYYFTNCTCEDCIKAKGDRSWQEFRLALMADVSRNVIVGPAKKINPKCKVIIKFPNWMESYAETGYNPGEEKNIFDKIYTGTETRNMMDQDQNLPRYLSYSLVRWMENLAPGANGGGWFDAYQCYPMESYLEQAYLTVFAKACEVMLFCWPLVYDHYFIPSLGFQLQKLDKLMQTTGKCVGLAEYHPVNAQGEDHLADYLGLLGMPFEPVSVFPVDRKSVFLTAAATADPDILKKLELYLRNGGHAIVTSGFLRLLSGQGIEQLTSIRYRGRSIEGAVFQYHSDESWNEYKIQASRPIVFPLMEHRNNASWMLLKGITDEKNFPILIADTYGKGEMTTLVVPDNFSDIKELPVPILTMIRRKFCSELPLYLECGKNIGLFLYDNDTFITYPYEYLNEGPQPCYIHIKGNVKRVTNSRGHNAVLSRVVKKNTWSNVENEMVYKIETQPDIFEFWKIER